MARIRIIIDVLFVVHSGTPKNRRRAASLSVGALPGGDDRAVARIVTGRIP